jgi:hypothetical protein
MRQHALKVASIPCFYPFSRKIIGECLVDHGHLGLMFAKGTNDDSGSGAR